MTLHIPSRGGCTHSVNTFRSISLWGCKKPRPRLSRAHCLPIRTYRTHASRAHSHRAESLDDARDDDARDDDDDGGEFDDDGFGRARVASRTRARDDGTSTSLESSSFPATARGDDDAHVDDDDARAIERARRRRWTRRRVPRARCAEEGRWRRW